jgi:hypothetical protein
MIEVIRWVDNACFKEYVNLPEITPQRLDEAQTEILEQDAERDRLGRINGIKKRTGFANLNLPFDLYDVEEKTASYAYPTGLYSLTLIGAGEGEKQTVWFGDWGWGSGEDTEVEQIVFTSKAEGDEWAEGLQ